MQLRKQYEFQKAITALLQNEVFVFSSEYGKKGVTDTNVIRLKNQITKAEDVKVKSNYNIWTGKGNKADVDLDCAEVRECVDDFLNPTGIEFGRSKHGGRSHRLYTVLDLDKKKHTKKAYTFRDNPDDTTIIELRAHNHYSMCSGTYDDGDIAIFNKAEKPAEITWDQLHKQVAMVGVASIMLRKARTSDPHNEFYKYMAGAFRQHKLEFDDAEKIFDSVIAHHGHCKRSERIGQLKSVYKAESTQELTGLPTVVKQWKWSKNEQEDFKKLLYAITGRHTLPAQTNDFVKRIAYMMKQKKYYDLEDKEMYDAEAIDVKYARDFKDAKYTPLLFWKKHPDRKVCVDFTYKPNTPERFVTVEKKLMINVYEENDLKPDPKVDTDLYWALVKHVIPHDDCRNTFLDWNAWILQNKGKKVRWGIIFQSDEFQLGKGSLYDINRDILGRVNAKKIELQQALDKGKGYLINSMMVLIDEAKSSGKWEEKQLLLNTMKTIMTEGSVGIRQLYKEYSEQDSCSNYWINTNHRDAFALPPNEVRYFVYFSEAKRNGKLLEDFHKARYNSNLAAGVYAEMLARDVSKFDPLGVAPWTKYRDMMTELADKPLNDYVKEGYEQGIYPLDRSIVTTTELFHWWRDKIKMKITRERDVAAALQLLDPKPIRVRGCPVVDVGASVNIWIIRDHDKYKNYTAKELGKVYQGFYTDSNTDNKRINRIDKADPFTRPVFKNATKAGEVDFEKNARDRDIAALIDKEDRY